MGQYWSTNSLGGHLTNNRLSKSLRKQALPEFVFRQFCDIKEGSGKKAGDTVYYDKVLKIDTKGSTLTETTTIPENKWKVVKASVTVEEYGNSVPWTAKLETLAEFDPNDISTTTLKNDMVEVIDSVAAVQFASAKYVAVCSTTARAGTIFTSNGIATIVATANMSDDNVREIVDNMVKKHIPPYDDSGMYRAIGSTDSIGGLYDQLQPIMQYTTPEFMNNNEVGQYYNTRFVRDNAYLSDAVGDGSAYGEAIFFGKEAVIEAVALAEEIRMKTPTDFGRSKGAAWYAILGFKKCWDLTDDDLNSTGKGIERIVRVTSA